MGSGIAGAVGLGVADPTRRVICVCGDGGMQMMGMEALVALRERLPVVFAVFNDARYNMVHHGMKQIFGAAGSWDTPWIDFCAWAGALGMPARRITAPGEIDAALLEELLAEGGPALLDIRIDRELRVRSGGRVESLVHMSMVDGGGSAWAHRSRESASGFRRPCGTTPTGRRASWRTNGTRATGRWSTSRLPATTRAGSRRTTWPSRPSGCGPIVNWWTRRQRGALDGGPIVLYAQGAGFTRAAALIDTRTR